MFRSHLGTNNKLETGERVFPIAVGSSKSTVLIGSANKAQHLSANATQRGQKWLVAAHKPQGRRTNAPAAL